MRKRFNLNTLFINKCFGVITNQPTWRRSDVIHIADDNYYHRNPSKKQRDPVKWHTAEQTEEGLHRLHSERSCYFCTAIIKATMINKTCWVISWHLLNTDSRRWLLALPSRLTDERELEQKDKKRRERGKKGLQHIYVFYSQFFLFKSLPCLITKTKGLQIMLKTRREQGPAILH